MWILIRTDEDEFLRYTSRKNNLYVLQLEPIRFGCLCQIKIVIYYVIDGGYLKIVLGSKNL